MPPVTDRGRGRAPRGLMASSGTGAPRILGIPEWHLKGRRRTVLEEQIYIATIDLYRYYRCTPLPHICTPTTELCPYHRSISLLQIYTPATALYRYYRSIPLPQIYIATTDIYPCYSSISLLQIYTPTIDLYRYYRSIPIPQIYIATTDLYPYHRSISLLRRLWKRCHRPIHFKLTLFKAVAAFFLIVVALSCVSDGPLLCSQRVSWPEMDACIFKRGTGAC